MLFVRSGGQMKRPFASLTVDDLDPPTAMCLIYTWAESRWLEVPAEEMVGNEHVSDSAAKLVALQRLPTWQLPSGGHMKGERCQNSGQWHTTPNTHAT